MGGTAVVTLVAIGVLALVTVLDAIQGAVAKAHTVHSVHDEELDMLRRHRRA